jgi:hypothetical protein
VYGSLTLGPKGVVVVMVIVGRSGLATATAVVTAAITRGRLAAAGAAVVRSCATAVRRRWATAPAAPSAAVAVVGRVLTGVGLSDAVAAQQWHLGEHLKIFCRI